MTTCTVVSACATPRAPATPVRVASQPAAAARLPRICRPRRGGTRRQQRNQLLTVSAVLDDGHKDVHTDYYQVLGVSQEADSSELRAAFRILAKAFHPDVAGQDVEGVFHLIKTAYAVLSHPESRSMYDAGRSLFGSTSAFGDFTGLPRSKNSCPSRPYAHFVDENSCIGCRACVFEAPNTFAMDESYGKARVAHQWADHEQNIDIAMEMCPVSCIHRVSTSDLPVLEFVQASMPARWVMIHSNSSDSGGVRGMEESPFVAAERFEAKKERLMEEAKERAKAAARMDAIRDAVESAGLGSGWTSWWGGANAGEEQDSAEIRNGPSCPLICRDPRVVLALPPAKEAQARS